MRLDVITIFPDYLAPLRLGLLGRAVRQGLLDLRVHDLRAFTEDAHRSVDDLPYGGGGGMVMRPEPWWRALEEVTGATAGSPPGGPRPWVVVPTPQGRPFTQSAAHALAQRPWLVFLCGRYEGIDQRVLDAWADEEVSLGDYVLAGGEAAVLVMVEAVGRLLPGVVGNPRSLEEDSFSGGAGLLEGPVYTRPAVFRGREVPEVLRSGDHAAIQRWRAQQAWQRTRARRPDLAGPDAPDHPATGAGQGVAD